MNEDTWVGVRSRDSSGADNFFGEAHARRQQQKRSLTKRPNQQTNRATSVISSLHDHDATCATM